MSQLNLEYPEKSDIKYKINRFPDGQQSITLNTTWGYLDVEVQIVSRLKTFRDLELVICATAALRNIGYSKISLYVPYFLGARSDRRFNDWEANYLKEVICPIVNSQKYHSVTVMDPHSDVLEACLENYRLIDNINLVKFALTDIDNRNDARDRIVIVSPDAGALKKIYKVAEHFKISNVITASKHRDIATGKITETVVPELEKYSDNHAFVIVDDICDGGRTFIEASKVIKQAHPSAKVYAIVTHGIFSNSFLELSRHFTKMYSTNSYSDIDVESHSDYTVSKDFLMQFNIF